MVLRGTNLNISQILRRGRGSINAAGTINDELLRGKERLFARLALAFFEFTSQCSTFAVNDVANPPAARSLDDDEGNRLLLAEIFKVRVNHRAAGFVARLGNREVLDFHVLRVIKRIAIDHSDFTFGLHGIFPDHVCQILFEVFVKQNATPRLKERAVFLVVNSIQLSHERIR